MKPDWDKLMEEFAGRDTQLVGDVDCTAEGKPICDSNDVKGFPTIKYGDPADLQDYQGGRDFDSMKEFADSNLGPSCTYPDNQDLCSEEQLAFMKEWAAKPEELKAEIAKHEATIKKLNDDFDEALKELQATYEKNQETRDEGVKEAKKPLSMLKAINTDGGEKSDL